MIAHFALQVTLALVLPPLWAAWNPGPDAASPRPNRRAA